jgi:hypothetical protein
MPISSAHLSLIGRAETAEPESTANAGDEINALSQSAKNIRNTVRNPYASAIQPFIPSYVKRQRDCRKFSQIND